MEFDQKGIIEGAWLTFNPIRDTFYEGLTLRLVGHDQQKAKCHLVPKGEPIDVTVTKKERHLKVIR